MIQRLWRKLPVWETCHFYRLIEIFLARQDLKGLNMLITPANHFVTHYCDAQAIQAILDENEQATQAMREKIEGLLTSVPEPVDCPITEWEAIFDLDLMGDWEPLWWNTRALDDNHSTYRLTVNAIKEVID